MAFLHTIIMALLSGLLSTLLWTAASAVMSGPSPALAQAGDPQQAAPTSEVRYVQISVEVFLDGVGVGGYECPGCNGLFDAADWTAQPAGALVAELVIRDGETGVEMARGATEATPGNPIGRAFFSVPAREVLVVELVQIPAGTILCPNSPRTRVIRPGEVGYGVISQTFTFWQGCPAVSFAAATATPVPMETVAPPPTDTPVPTDTPAPTATPVPPTPTPPPPPSPTEEPQPTAVSIVLQPPTPTTAPPPAPTPAPPPPAPTQAMAPTPTAEPVDSPVVSEEPTVASPKPTPVPTDVPGPAVPSPAAGASPELPAGPGQGPAVRALSVTSDQQELQRAIAKALSERQGGAEGLDAQALTQVLARAVEIRVEEKAEEMRLAYEQSLRQERRQGMVMAFFTGVAGVFTASFWKALVKGLLAIAAKGIAAASPGWGSTLLLTLVPLAGLSRRQCSNCRHYQPSAMRGQGWCRNPRLYAPHVRHLVHASDLDCARTHFPDLWEPLATVREEQIDVPARRS